MLDCIFALQAGVSCSHHARDVPYGHHASKCMMPAAGKLLACWSRSASAAGHQSDCHGGQARAFASRQVLRRYACLGPGVLVGTVLTAVAVKYTFPYGWSWTLALLFGAMFSATDPVAVVAVLREVRSC